MYVYKAHVLSSLYTQLLTLEHLTVICPTLSDFTQEKRNCTRNAMHLLKKKKVGKTKLGTFLGLAPRFMNKVLVCAIQVNCHRNCFDCYKCQ